MTDDTTVQIFGRLTAHEFAIEVMFASMMADLPEVEADRRLDDYLHRTRAIYAGYGVPDVDEDAVRQIAADAVEITKQLIDKVRLRSRIIRIERASCS